MTTWAADIDCGVAAEPEVGAVMATLSPMLEACRASYMAECRRAVAPFVELADREAQAVFTGIVGAAEAPAHAAAAGALGRDEAVATLSKIILAALADAGEGSTKTRPSTGTSDAPLKTISCFATVERPLLFARSSIGRPPPTILAEREKRAFFCEPMSDRRRFNRSGRRSRANCGIARIERRRMR